MRSLVRGVAVVAVTLLVALRAGAATSSEFYVTMLQKGVAAYNAGRFDSAVGSLRIAAFGFVDSVDYYQTAQVYLALTHDRMGNADSARDAARRVVIAEKIDPRFASLQLPAATRTAFDAVARKVLQPADITLLSAPPRTTTQTKPPVSTPPANNTQTTPIKTEPAPVKPAPAPVKTEPKIDPKPTQPAQTRPATTTPPQKKPEPVPAKPAPVQTQPARPAINVAAQFAAGESALMSARLTDARAIYRELLDSATLQRSDLLRVAEGLYRARDFAYAIRAFDRLGAMRRGEEPYRYYIAVALYETAQYARAKQELDAVLPYIEVTPDVARYRTKIEGAAR